MYPGFGNDQEDYSCRAQYAAMVNLLDDNVALLVNTLKSKQDPAAAAAASQSQLTQSTSSLSMWDNTLLVFHSDNVCGVSGLSGEWC